MSLLTFMRPAVLKTGVQGILRNIQHLCRTELRAHHLLCRTYELPITSFALQKCETVLTPYVPFISQIAGFKVKARLRRRCKDCYFMVEDRRMYVLCPTHPRHKQMALMPKEKSTWILTHATQSKVRPW